MHCNAGSSTRPMRQKTDTPKARIEPAYARVGVHLSDLIRPLADGTPHIYACACQKLRR